MASVMRRDFSVDYSIVDGRVKNFEARGKILYDEDAGIATEGWEEMLCAYVEQAELHRPTAHGRLPFVKRLIEEGKVKDADQTD